MSHNKFHSKYNFNKINLLKFLGQKVFTNTLDSLHDFRLSN